LTTHRGSVRQRRSAHDPPQHRRFPDLPLCLSLCLALRPPPGPDQVLSVRATDNPGGPSRATERGLPDRPAGGMEAEERGVRRPKVVGHHFGLRPSRASSTASRASSLASWSSTRSRWTTSARMRSAAPPAASGRASGPEGGARHPRPSRRPRSRRGSRGRLSRGP
jgi:hypothetical protein